MSFTKLAIRFAAPLPKIEEYERFLFIGPHPDDIEIGAGATAAKLAAKGKKVCFLICIDGRYGDSNLTAEFTPEELVSVRTAEAKCSAEACGVSDVRFLGLCDGGFYSYDDLLRGIAKTVGDFKPDVIFAPDPDVTSECHIDHLNVGRAAKHIAEFAPYGGIMANYGAGSAPVSALALYMTAKPNELVDTTGFFETQQRAIFDCHLSQFPEGCANAKSIGLYLKLRATEFGLRLFSRSAEGFRVLGKTHMHCLPEAGN